MTSSPLAHKLDAFLRKYYLNALLRGLLLNTALLVSSLLIIVLLEYWGWFGSTVRALLFWGYLGAFIVATFWWVARPLSWLFRLRQPLKYEEAALIVGNHFSAVRDKLLNALQLEQQQKQHPESVLLQAAIDQKRKELSVFDFRQAVNLGLNRKYLPYALPPLLALAFILFAAPAIVLDPVYRIAHYKEPFSPPPPFRFVVSDPLETTENQNYLLRVVTEGLVVPEEMSIEIEGASYSMLREAAGRFSFEFRAPRTDIHFRLRCGKYYSEPMVLKVRKKAALLHLRIMARYPAYTGLNAQTFEQGDITVPEGTLLEFQMHVKNTHSVKFLTDSLKPLLSLEPEDGRVALTYRARNSLSYRIALSGTEGSGDTLRFNLTVIPDRFPEITVEERGDSLMSTLRAFRGDLRDDYGLRSLTFSYEIRGTDGRSGGRQKVSLPLPSGARQHLFVHTMDFGLLQPAPGDQIHYSFIVCDNDGVHGSKCTSTPERILRIPTLEEQQERTRQTDQSVADNISGSLQQSQRMDKELQSLQRQLTEKRGSDWQDRKKAEDLLRMEESLRRQIEQLKKDMETAQRLREQWPNDPTLEERKALEKETDKLLTDELRHLLEEIRKLLEQQGDRSQLKEMVEQARETTLSLEKQLERLRELFKKLELESLLNAAADKLDQMAREQRREAEENRQAGADQVSQAQQDQYKINQDFQDLKQQLKEIEQKNQALENPMDHLSELQEQAADIQQELDRASEKLEQNTPRKASEHQKNAASKMEEMARAIREQIQQQREEDQAEDAETVKRLLRSLLTLSFNQEQLMGELRNTSRNSPVFRDLAQKQRRLRDDARTVEDSLFALSKRQIRITETVNKEIADIRKNMEKAIQRLADRDGANAGVYQQYVMTGFNNLALMLSESLENMQLQMSMKMKGGAACKKPGSDSEPSPGEMQQIREMQKKLGEQLQKMAEQMKQGKEGQKPGDRQNVGQQGLNSREIAQMVAQQEMLRRKLRQLAEKQSNLQQKRLLNEIQQQMEQNEYDLLHKKLTEQSLLRQREIMVRLLEFEKAQREQDQDEQRQSRPGEDIPRPTAPTLADFEKEKERITEMLRTVPPHLKPYYRERVQRYMNERTP